MKEFRAPRQELVEKHAIKPMLRDRLVIVTNSPNYAALNQTIKVMTKHGYEFKRWGAPGERMIHLVKIPVREKPTTVRIQELLEIGSKTNVELSTELDRTKEEVSIAINNLRVAGVYVMSRRVSGHVWEYWID